jgi:hypothetical protein
MQKKDKRARKFTIQNVILFYIKLQKQYFDWYIVSSRIAALFIEALTIYWLYFKILLVLPTIKTSPAISALSAAVFTATITYLLNSFTHYYRHYIKIYNELDILDIELNFNLNTISDNDYAIQPFLENPPTSNLIQMNFDKMDINKNPLFDIKSPQLIVDLARLLTIYIKINGSLVTFKEGYDRSVDILVAKGAPIDIPQLNMFYVKQAEQMKRFLADATKRTEKLIAIVRRMKKYLLPGIIKCFIWWATDWAINPVGWGKGMFRKGMWQGIYNNEKTSGKEMTEIMTEFKILQEQEMKESQAEIDEIKGATSAG